MKVKAIGPSINRKIIMRHKKINIILLFDLNIPLPYRKWKYTYIQELASDTDNKVKREPSPKYPRVIAGNNNSKKSTKLE
jgi:hypothetical protein